MAGSLWGNRFSMAQLKSLVMASRVTPISPSARPTLKLISVASIDEENFQPANIENIDNDEAKRHGALNSKKRCNFERMYYLSVLILFPMVSKAKINVF